MSSRDLNRRSLGKTIVAMAMLAAVQPLSPFVAAEETKTRKRTELPDAALGQKPMIVCILRRMPAMDDVTFLKKRDTVRRSRESE